MEETFDMFRMRLESMVRLDHPLVVLGSPEFDSWPHKTVVFYHGPLKNHRVVFMNGKVL